MKLEQYFQLMADPRLLNEESLKSLAELIRSYPYVENFRILYALNLLLLDDFKYQENLHKAAIYSSDRKKLKYWINYLIQESGKDQEEGPTAKIYPSDETIIVKEEHSEQKELEETDVVKDSKEALKTDAEVSNIEEDNYPKNVISLSEASDPAEIERQSHTRRTKSELLKLVRKRLAEIESENDKNEDPLEKNKSDEETKNFKANLIDRFIESQPSISRPDKTDFFDPQKEAIDSTLDDDDFFVTETLAHIHVQQGNFQKAIEIYRKLILKIPEKSTYFAAQIQELSRK